MGLALFHVGLIRRHPPQTIDHRSHEPLDRAHLKLSLRDAGFGVGRKAGTRRNSKAISRASNTASGFEDKSQQISLR